MGRCGPRVFDGPALDGPTPEILVDRVDLLLRRLDGDLPLLGEVDRIGAGHPPVARRGEHFEIRGQRVRAHFETHLIVALTRAAVRHGLSVECPRLRDEVTHDHRTRQRRDQRILVLVARVRGDGLGAELLGHLVARVHEHAVDRPGHHGARPNVIEALGALGVLADVDEDTNDFDAPLLDHPANRHRRVESPAVGEDHALRHDYLSFLGWTAESSRPARDRNSVASDMPPRFSSAITMTVSSPATLPSTPSRALRSNADATT